MKEAAGEANLTVVAIILIAVVVAVATPLINSLMKTSVYRACCTDSGAVWKKGGCYGSEYDKNEYSANPQYTEAVKCADDALGVPSGFHKVWASG